MMIKAGRRKSINVSSKTLIKTELLEPGKPLPLVVKPTVEGLDLAAWATGDREWIKTQLLKHGGLLFRGFQVNGITGLEQFIETISGQLIEYSYRSTPRTRVSGNIYTSTEYPASQSIPLHNEMAYSLNWPMKIAFYCVKAAEKGGETPIADSRNIFERLDPTLKKMFMQKQLVYVRNYGEGVDLQWENVFQTDERSRVEEYCRQAGIEFEWGAGNHLRTRQVCQAVATHPQTGEMVWFNQAHLFHISSLETDVRQSLVSAFKAEDLPRNVYYGDGSVIEDSVLDEIRQIYQQEAIIFPWQEEDVLLLDNMLAAHGRQPFVGQRKVVVGMAEPFSNPSRN